MNGHTVRLGLTTTSTDLLFLYQDIKREDLTLKARETYKKTTYTHSKFKGDLTMEKKEVLEMIKDLQRQDQKADAERSVEVVERSREEEVNQIRQRVLDSLIVYPHHSTKKAIASDAGCHTQTVTRILQWLAFSSLPMPLYRYNKGHSTEILERLDESITNPTNQMLSIADHKRRVPQCSRKFIASRLRNVHGLRYLKLRRERKDPTKDKSSPTRKISQTLLKTVLLTSVQAFARGRETILYLDECEFGLYQTAEYCWAKRGEVPVYNRREKESSLHVIGLCSQERYLAIQVFDKHPNKQDIHYFLTTFLTTWKSQGKLIILLDNAGWHVANTVMKSEYCQYLLYNVPKMYQLNLIELTFSKAKAEWRKRPVSESVEEEIEELVRIFKEVIPKKGFGGYRRQYLRQVKVITEEVLSLD